jgi:hypothetical protein
MVVDAPFVVVMPLVDIGVCFIVDTRCERRVSGRFMEVAKTDDGTYFGLDCSGGCHWRAGTAPGGGFWL